MQMLHNWWSIILLPELVFFYLSLPHSGSGIIIFWAVWIRSECPANKTMSCGISGLTLKQPSQLYHYRDCDWLCFWLSVRQLSWDFGSNSQKMNTTNSDFISVWLSMSAVSERQTPRRQGTNAARCLFTVFPLLTLPCSLLRLAVCSQAVTREGEWK